MKSRLLQREELQNLFRPGTGDQPPYLAGREKEEQIFNITLSNLLRDQRNPSGHIICYGPRGNGKTVLLRDQQKQLQEKGISTLWLTATALQSKENFLKEIVSESKEALKKIKQEANYLKWTKYLRWLQPEVQLDLSEDIQTKIKLTRLIQNPEEKIRPVTLKDIIRQVTKENKNHEKEPLILFIDEAHTMEPELGQMILNDSQTAIGENQPFLLVLAGTPQLEGHLQGISATFWSRSEKIKLGRISEKATQDAITIPLQKYGITVEKKALQILTEQTQGYPYFTQLWGRELCRQLQPTRENTITTTHVTQGQDQFTEQKDLYYLERFQEIKKQELLPLAESTAQTLLKQDKPIDAELLEYELQEHTGQDLKTIQEGIKTFKKLGYLWTPSTKPEYEPGIPSLMMYLLEIQKERETRLMEETIQETLEENPCTPSSTEKKIAEGIIQKLKMEKPNPRLILEIQVLRHQYEHINPQEQDQEIDQYLSCKAKLRPNYNQLRGKIQTIQRNRQEEILKEAQGIQSKNQTRTKEPPESSRPR